MGFLQNAVGAGPCATLLLLLCLGGCAATNAIDVTRQTTLPPAVKGAPFIVLLSNDQGDEASYKDYATTLVTQLQSQGLAAVQDAKNARYAVMLDRTWPHRGQDTAEGEAQGSGGGGMGRGGGFRGGGGHHHGGGGDGSNRTDSRDTSLQIAVFDLSKPNSPQEKVFYAEVKAPIGHDENDAAVDAMISAALKDFPGKTHETYSIDLPETKPGSAG